MVDFLLYDLMKEPKLLILYYVPFLVRWKQTYFNCQASLLMREVNMVSNSIDANQRPKISVFIATSLDGYIAKQNDELDWLENVNSQGCDEDYGFKEFLSSIDTLVMGRGTYKIASKVEDWPYKGKRVVVLSKKLKEVRNDAELYSGDITAIIQKLYEEGSKHIYVDGGITISQFINAGYIDQMILTIVPVILGQGICLYKDIFNESWYQLLSTQSYPNGLVQLRYQRK